MRTERVCSTIKIHNWESPLRQWLSSKSVTEKTRYANCYHEKMLCYNSFADKKGKIYFLLILKEYLYKYTFSKLVCISYKNIFMKETDHAGTNLVFLMLQENKSRGISGSIKKTKTTYLISKNKGNYHKIYNPFF